MAIGIAKLRRVAFAKESTVGTANTTPTSIWRAKSKGIESKQVIDFVEEDVGIIGGTNRSNSPSVMATLDLPDVAATFEQFAYFPAWAFGGPVTGTNDTGTGATGKIYQTSIPTTGTPSPVSYTFLVGDNIDWDYMEYGLCTKFSIKGTTGKAVTMGGNLIGRRITSSSGGTFSSAPIPTSVETAITSSTKLYLDLISGSYGTTQITNEGLGFEINFEPMWQPIFTEDGNLYPTFFTYVGHKISGSFTLVYDSLTTAFNLSGGVATVYANAKAQLPALFRLSILGSALATAGTYTNKTINIDLPIKYSKVPMRDDQDGIGIFKAEFNSMYDTTAGNAGKITVVLDGVATLP